MVVKNFEASAVNLCNPPEVKELLDELSAEEAALKVLTDELEVKNLELTEKIRSQEVKVVTAHSLVKDAIETHGSYQDTENERYGVMYARKTAVFGNLPSFKKNFPKFVELCIKETIDVNALKGQIKGKLITEEQLEKVKVLTYDTGYAFYVR